MRKSVCIVSFSQISNDARILRQIKYLSNNYDLTVVGFGDSDLNWKNNADFRWIRIEKSKVPGILSFGILLLGKFWFGAYDRWYWMNKTHVQAYQQIQASHFDVIHANEWNALPLAIEAAKINHAKVVFDAHEYTPGQYEDANPIRKWLLPNAFIYLFNKYFPLINASITIAPLIAELYRAEFSIDPLVVMNAPESIQFQSIDGYQDKINMIHHGFAKRDRHLEILISTIALCDSRYHLHFMLLGHDRGYEEHLQELAEKLAPGRVDFHTPVRPENIVRKISEYDIGLSLLAPTNINYRFALPNKFLDFIAAGLAVCIGPSPSMAEIVNKYGLGIIAPTFEPEAVAKMLNQLSSDKLARMKDAARKASLEINAQKEMSKVVSLYERLLS
jgi:glycosyltransferase involved in cell wall biosynthesis